MEPEHTCWTITQTWFGYWWWWWASNRNCSKNYKDFWNNYAWAHTTEVEHGLNFRVLTQLDPEVFDPRTDPTQSLNAPKVKRPAWISQLTSIYRPMPTAAGTAGNNDGNPGRNTQYYWFDKWGYGSPNLPQGYHQHHHQYPNQVQKQELRRDSLRNSTA